MKTENTSQTARVNRPHRTQMELQLLSLEQMLPPDHRARDVWAFASSLDLEPFYRDIEVTDDSPGRPAIAPEILVALWLLAMLDGIGSARELDRRCETDIPYLWILGTVRAAQEHVDRLKREAESEGERLVGDNRRKAANERAARERQDRLDDALRQHEKLSQQREQWKKGKRRVVTAIGHLHLARVGVSGADTSCLAIWPAITNLKIRCWGQRENPFRRLIQSLGAKDDNCLGEWPTGRGA